MSTVQLGLALVQPVPADPPSQTVLRARATLAVVRVAAPPRPPSGEYSAYVPPPRVLGPVERDCVPSEEHGARCYAAEKASTVAELFHVEVHAMLRGDGGAALGARGKLTADLVERGWTCADVERWYGMRAGAACVALVARRRVLARQATERRAAEEREAAARKAAREAQVAHVPGQHSTCACGRVARGPDSPSKRNVRLETWGSVEWVCASCAQTRLRARQRAERLAASSPQGQDNPPPNGK